MKKTIHDAQWFADYWRKKSKVTYSVWDNILHVPRPADVHIRDSPALVLRAPYGSDMKDEDKKMVREFKLKDMLDHCTEQIVKGFPLTFPEYHIAVGFGLLTPPEGTSYKEFFLKRWHETASHFGYGKAGETCTTCTFERPARGKARKRSQ